MTLDLSWFTVIARRAATKQPFFKKNTPSIKPFHIYLIKEENLKQDNMKRIVFTVAFLLIASTGLIKAQTTPKVTARQTTQQARIADGVSDKELTRHETRRLEREQRKIQNDKKEAKADGTVSPEERKVLRKEQNRANRHIKRQKHDGQGR
jgi:hypothetical protein